MTDEDPTIARASRLLKLDSVDIKRPVFAGLGHFSGVAAGRKRVVAAIVIYCVFAVIALKVWLSLPFTPEPAAGAFRFGGSGLDLLLFGLMMLWLGWAGAWLGKTCATAQRPLLYLIPALPVLAVIAYFFLWLAFTREFIEDLVGPNVLFYRVIEQDFLGEKGVQLFQLLGLGNAQSLTKTLEPWVRFSALIMPLPILACICSAIFILRKEHSPTKPGTSWKTVSIALILLVCLYLCKLVAFDWASTDSVTRILAGDGSLSHLGLGSLILLLLAFCGAGAFLYYYWLRLQQKSGPGQQASRKRVELRVYSSQLEFLKKLSVESRVPVRELVNRVTEYFLDQASNVPGSRAKLKAYIENRDFNKRVEFAPDKLSVKIDADSFELLTSLNCNGIYSESRVFRKLLEVFIRITGSEDV